MARPFQTWVGSTVRLDTYEKRHVYEWDDDPVEREMRWEGLEKVSARIFSVLEFKSYLRRRMLWTTVGTLLANFIERSFVCLHILLFAQYIFGF